MECILPYIRLNQQDEVTSVEVVSVAPKMTGKVISHNDFNERAVES